MATKREELNEAELAHEALNAPTTIDDAINVLSFSSQKALNNSRHEVVIAFNDLIRSHQKGVSAPDKIGKAKRAVEDWVRELRRA
jgi:hypothetical protein